MASQTVPSISLFLFSFFIVASLNVEADRVLEEGYTVSTVLDGHKLRVNPHSVVPRSGSSDLLVLDSSGSVFYTVSFPISEGDAMKRFSGNGVAGFQDGDVGVAMFNKPRSFAVDLKGTVYVADQKNHAIRKITRSGVTTIAGGLSNKAGRDDGPAQNATFSDDFELTFVAERCALLVSDHGNQLIRQVDLKVEDCGRGSRSVLGAASIWVSALAVSCLVGIIVGVAVRPYIFPNGVSVSGHAPSTETWKQCLTNLEKQARTTCFDIKSAAASSSLHALVKRLFRLIISHISLILNLRINKVEPLVSVSPKEPVSFLDSDILTSREIRKSEIIANQLKDLVTFDETLELSNMSNNFDRGDENQEIDDSTYNCYGRNRIDCLIQANIVGFVKGAGERNVPESYSGLVKRK